MSVYLNSLTPVNDYGAAGSVLSSIGTVARDAEELRTAEETAQAVTGGSGTDGFSSFAAALQSMLAGVDGSTETDGTVSGSVETASDSSETGGASENAVAFIAEHEGFSAAAYRGADYQNQTIGYGHVIEPGESFQSLTQPQAMDLLKSDLTPYVESVNKEFSDTNLTQNQKDALVSFSYNLGANIWSETPQLVSDIKSGATADTLKEDFLRCDNCNGAELTGLRNRRLDEYNLFISQS